MLSSFHSIFVIVVEYAQTHDIMTLQVNSRGWSLSQVNGRIKSNIAQMPNSLKYQNEVSTKSCFHVTVVVLVAAVCARLCAEGMC